MNLIKKSVAVGIIALAGLGLVACSPTTNESGYEIPETVTMDYNGNPLNCVTWWGSHSETGLTCDFVEYHTLYPEAVFDETAENVKTVDYKGNPLNCVTWWGSHNETGLTCDFVEYNANF